VALIAIVIVAAPVIVDVHVNVNAPVGVFERPGRAVAADSVA
jgi:hypothetical protein